MAIKWELVVDRMESKSIKETSLEQLLLRSWMSVPTIHFVKCTVSLWPIVWYLLYWCSLQLCFLVEEVGVSGHKLRCPRITQICFKLQSFDLDYGLSFYYGLNVCAIFFPPNSYVEALSWEWLYSEMKLWARNQGSMRFSGWGSLKGFVPS